MGAGTGSGSLGRSMHEDAHYAGGAIDVHAAPEWVNELIGRFRTRAEQQRLYYNDVPDWPTPELSDAAHALLFELRELTGFWCSLRAADLDALSELQGFLNIETRDASIPGQGLTSLQVRLP